MIRDIEKSNNQVSLISREIEGLHEYFPQCFEKNGSFDIDKFRETIAAKIDVTREGRSYDFLGKSYARMLSSLDTTTVIRPDIEHNNKPENANSENIYISGDNLDALHHLVKSYAGQIKCIYIDPPYNTGTDGFVYNDKFRFTAEELEKKLSVSQEEAQKIIAMTSGHRASHAAWLTFMMPRLQLARELLSKDGVIFISIDDNEQAYLKQLCDNVFGEDNFITQIVWQKIHSIKNDAKYFSDNHEYALVYCRNIDFVSIGLLNRTELMNARYKNPDNDKRGPWQSGDLVASGERRTGHFIVTSPKTGKQFDVPEGKHWVYSEENMKELIKDNQIWFGIDGNSFPRKKRFLAEVQDGRTANSLWLSNEVGHNQTAAKEIKNLFDGLAVFDTPKPVQYIKQMIQLSTDIGSIIVDFFSGSATTADSVMTLNAEDGGQRRFLLVQLPELCKDNSNAYKAGYRTIDEIGIERIKRAAKKIREENPQYVGDLGFKHYTLEDVPDDTLDKLETFDPNVLLTSDDTLKLFGRETVLTTWFVQDGYGLNAKAKDIDLANYHATLCGNHLYMTDCGFSEDNMVSLIDLYQKEPSFCPDCIVLFGYSFSHNAKDMLEKNKPTIELVKDIKLIVDVRY